MAGTARDARLTGVFTAHDSRVDSGGTLTAFDTATAQRHFAPGPKGYSAITLTAAEGTTDAQLAQHAQKLLPSGLPVTRADLESGTATDGDADKLTTLLLGFAGVALFVSTFLVANTFTMLSAARVREHALLRAVGAATNRVMRMVLTEAAVVGTVASAIGHGLGVGAAHLLGSLFDASGAGHATVSAHRRGHRVTEWSERAERSGGVDQGQVRGDERGRHHQGADQMVVERVADRFTDLLAGQPGHSVPGQHRTDPVDQVPHALLAPAHRSATPRAGRPSAAR
ncbi:ABC transporter permease [Streptomyces indonesiensis]